jgi:hypothetical protein
MVVASSSDTLDVGDLTVSGEIALGVADGCGGSHVKIMLNGRFVDDGWLGVGIVYLELGVDESLKL